MRRGSTFRPMFVDELESRQLLSGTTHIPAQAQALISELQNGQLNGAAAQHATKLAQHYGFSVSGQSSTAKTLSPSVLKRIDKLEKTQANRQALINALTPQATTPQKQQALAKLQYAQNATANYIASVLGQPLGSSDSASSLAAAASAGQAAESGAANNLPVSGSGSSGSTSSGSSSSGTSTSSGSLTNQQIVQLVSVLGSFANTYTSGANVSQDQAALQGLRVGIDAIIPGSISDTGSQSAIVDLLGGNTIASSTIALLRGAVNAFETNYTYGANPTIDQQTLQNFGNALIDISVLIPTPVSSVSTNNPSSSSSSNG